MAVEDAIEQTETWQNVQQQRQKAEQQVQNAYPMQPVVSFEKTDIQFWADIAQVVLLLYIAYHISQ